MNTIDTNGIPIRIHTVSLKRGITRSPEFEKKTLAQYGCNTGTRCSNFCRFCSSNSILRTHYRFKEVGEKPYEFGYAIIDPDIAAKVARDAKRMRNRGCVMISTTTDGWCSAADKHDLGTKCLQAILNEPDWTCRVLTKNAEVAKAFPIMQQYKDRVLFSMSLTAPESKTNIINAIEENASPITDRFAVLREAHRTNIPCYAMLCPLMPFLTAKDIEELVLFAEEIGAGEIFAEAINLRGRSLIDTQLALEAAGYNAEAKAIEAIRNQKNWSKYVTDLIQTVQNAVRKHSDIRKLRFLLYPSGLQQNDLDQIKKDQQGIIWL
jgi:DNA repair photolyase